MLPMLPTSELLPQSYKYQLARSGVNWFAPVNVTTYNNGKTIKKTGGTATVPYDAGIAGRTEMIGDGYLEFRSGNPNGSFVIGLNDEPPSATSFTDLEFSLSIQANSTYFVFEDASFIPAASYSIPNTYSPDDKFRIVRQGSTIHYQTLPVGKSSYVTFYTSTKNIINEGKRLFVDVGMYTVGGIITDITVGIAPNTLWPGYGFTSGSTNQPSYINSYFNNLNGPYGNTHLGNKSALAKHQLRGIKEIIISSPSKKKKTFTAPTK